MIDAGNDFGPGTSYGSALVKCGQTQQKLGQAKRDFIQATTNNFLQQLKAFLDTDVKTLQKERKTLETLRLDLDAAKAKLRRCKAPAGKESDEDVIAKAEAEVRVAQAEFDRQVEVTRLLLEGISSTHAHHLHCLHDLIEAQATYYAQCHQYMTDLQKSLGSEQH
jgi:endophilin-B